LLSPARESAPQLPPERDPPKSPEDFLATLTFSQSGRRRSCRSKFGTVWQRPMVSLHIVKALSLTKKQQNGWSILWVYSQTKGADAPKAGATRPSSV